MVPWGVPLTNWGEIWGSGMSLLVGALSCGLRGARKGLKKPFSVAPEPRVRQTYKFHPNSVRRGQKPPFQLLTFFYRACVGLALLQPSKPLLCALQPEPKKNRRFFCLQTIPGAPLRAPCSAKMDHKNANFGPAEPEISIIITKSLF